MASAPGTPMSNASAPGTPMSNYQRAKLRDPNMPKRPTSAYFLYSIEKRAATKKELGDAATTGTISRLMARRWAEESEATKRRLQAQFEESKKKYTVAIDKYKHSDARTEFLAKQQPPAAAAAAPATPPPTQWSPALEKAGRKRGSLVDSETPAPSTPAPLPPRPWPSREAAVVPAAVNGHAALDLTSIPSSLILQELARRLGSSDPLVALLPPQLRPQLRPPEGRQEAAAVQPEAKRAKAEPTPAQKKQIAAAAAAAAVQEDELPEGFRFWLNKKRRARIVEDLGTDDEEEVIDEGLIQWTVLSQGVREKYLTKARMALL
mmetsp:Transcript_57996/g.188708  ORF Transcript_57996/g.188708 Transcript_57996/m.188708 type:complete len:321 (-) Transcript_57996:29-991(-)